MDKAGAFILWFDQIGIEDVPFVGGKNASLGEMYCLLTPRGINVPNGFCVTALAYRHFIEKAGIKEKIRKILSGVDAKNIRDLEKRGSAVRKLILSSKLPKEIEDAIKEGYMHLGLQYGKNTDVAVRSSATAEDLPGASFAGQQETYLNIKGDKALVEACKKCFASLFTNRAISYRIEKKFDHMSIALSIGIQKMVRSDRACSGIMFTIDTESGFRDVVYINASYGLGENVVQGAVNPDQFYVFKPTLGNFKPILSKVMGTKKIKMIYGKKQPTINISTTAEERQKFVLNESEILTLAKWGCTIEEHYSGKAGKHQPMDIEWAKDGILNRLFIGQARPETVHSVKDRTVFERYELKEKGRVIVAGNSVGDKIAKGKAHIIKSVHQIKEFKSGGILVTEMTDPDWVPIMKIASAIVTDKGGRASHAAIVSRELGLPCIVGTSEGTRKIRNGSSITISCAEGEEGFVYEGLLKFDIEKIDLKQVPETKTKVMMNVGEPESAFELSHIPNSGVGLAREEFIINSYIKIHPLALINYGKIKEKAAKKQIDALTYGYKDKSKFFIDKLAEGIAMIAAAFYPNDVIVRFSDFKSNEYANLIGGKSFEPKEENPMLGWRGAVRYYSENFRKAFDLECRAFLKVRNEMGLVNVKAMVPMCRTVEEGKKVLKIMEENGLKKGENGFQVYVMCELPANVILAEEFAEIFDGFSIGSNDLTQTTLGLDRDSALVSHLFDERNPAVKKLVAMVIEVAKKKGKKIGICGQAPSDYPEFAEFLVDCEIDSISLNPDAVLKTTLLIAKREEELGRR